MFIWHLKKCDDMYIFSNNWWHLSLLSRNQFGFSTFLREFYEYGATLRFYFMCIFLMVATNEICKFKVKFTLFSPSPVILNDDIHWTKLILFFKIDLIFLIWHIRGLFGFLQFMRRKGTHSLATTLNCIW